MVLEEVSFHSSKDKFDPKQGTSRRTYRVRRMSCWRLWLIARMLPPWRSIWTWHWVIRWHAMLSSPSSESGGGEEPRCAHNHWSSCSQPCWYALVTSVSNFFSSVECSLRSYLSATNTIGKTSHNHFLIFFYNSTVWQCHNGDWSHPFLASSPFYKKNVQSKKLRPAPAKVPLLPGSICANTGLTSSPFLAAVGPWAISSTRSHGAFPPARGAEYVVAW